MKSPKNAAREWEKALLFHMKVVWKHYTKNLLNVNKWKLLYGKSFSYSSYLVRGVGVCVWVRLLQHETWMSLNGYIKKKVILLKAAEMFSFCFCAFQFSNDDKEVVNWTFLIVYFSCCFYCFFLFLCKRDTCFKTFIRATKDKKRTVNELCYDECEVGTGPKFFTPKH